MKNLKLLFILPLITQCDLFNDDSDFEISGLSALSVLSKENIFFPEFDSEILHYGASFANDSSVTVIASSDDENNEIYLNNLLIGKGSVNYTLPSPVSNQNIVIEIKNNGKSLKYYLHNANKSEPRIEISQKTSFVDDGFILTSPRINVNGNFKTYLFISDNNGVIRFKKIIDGVATDFKKHNNGKYSYALRGDGNAMNNWSYEIIILDELFNEVDRVKTINLNHTDNHDFLITPSDTYILLSYHTSYRDFSSYGYSENEAARDSYIQEVSKDGKILFEWNSWDNINIDGCLNHRFPDDYAHINAIQLAPDGNLIASFRGCSSILKIDRSSGETIWSVGGADPTLSIEGDPYEEFCGQHTASESEDGYLYIFDNGGHCNGERENKYGQFSRALQYKINLNQSKLTFVRDYSFNNTYSRYTKSAGSFFVTEKGNWLINWANGIQTVTEVSKTNDTELEFNIVNNSDTLRTYRAYRAYDLKLPIDINGNTTFESFQN